MRIDQRPSQKNEEQRLEQVLTETSESYVSTRCCTIKRGGNTVAVVSGVGPNH